jgi:hypothetical protein
LRVVPHCMLLEGKELGIVDPPSSVYIPHTVVVSNPLRPSYSLKIESCLEWLTRGVPFPLRGLLGG